MRTERLDDAAELVAVYHETHPKSASAVRIRKLKADSNSIEGLKSYVHAVQGPQGIRLQEALASLLRDHRLVEAS